MERKVEMTMFCIAKEFQESLSTNGCGSEQSVSSEQSGLGIIMHAIVSTNV